MLAETGKTQQAHTHTQQKGHLCTRDWVKRREKKEDTETETEKELYHVYYSLAAGEFKCARLRWNRAGVIIIASCLLDRTLK